MAAVSTQAQEAADRLTPPWRPLPIDGDSPFAALPAVFSLVVWPAIRFAVEVPVYLARHVRRAASYVVDS